MANLLTLKRRIKTAQNVSKTTRAMQMIAASKLKRAQKAALSSRPYVEELTSLSKGMAKRTDKENYSAYMIEPRNIQKTLLVVVSPDKGLCGGLVTNLMREVTNFEKDNKNISYLTVGKKTEGVISSHGKEIVGSFEFGTVLPLYEQVFPLLKIIEEQFLGGKVSKVNLAYSHFGSVFSQAPRIRQLLPVSFEDEAGDENLSQMQFEPNVSNILPYLLKHYLEMSIYQTFLENHLSEQAARMLAMQNATDNAKEIIEELKLEYNKSRQEKITNEILDISGGIFANA